MKTIIVVGRRWFDSKNGNTYHTAEIFLNGDIVYRSPVTYGYDNAYIQTAADWLESSDIVKCERYANGCKQQLSQACKEQNIKLGCARIDVRTKKDLTA